MICLDQRGAGGSRPRGSTQRNTTADLLADLHLLRGQLGLSRWFVVGGSWGATLALAHAAAEPDAVQALLLRASFLARPEDIGWFFQGAATELPVAWARFAGAAPAEHRAALLPWLRHVFSAAEPAEQMRAARAWWAWEQALASQGNAGPPQVSLPASGGGRRMASAWGRSDASATPTPPAGEALTALVDRFRVQSHYLANHCWLTAPPLLERLGTLPQVPTLLLHADDDRICRPAGAAALHERVPHSRLRWVAAAGHDPAHPAMASAMRAALDSYAELGDFDGVTP
jgi:proline iminopeptidase